MSSRKRARSANSETPRTKHNTKRSVSPRGNGGATAKKKKKTTRGAANIIANKKLPSPKKEKTNAEKQPWGRRADNRIASMFLIKTDSKKHLNTSVSTAVDFVLRAPSKTVGAGFFDGFVAKICRLRGLDENGDAVGTVDKENKKFLVAPTATRFWASVTDDTRVSKRLLERTKTASVGTRLGTGGRGLGSGALRLAQRARGCL